MQSLYLDIVSAFWLGILTSISPCSPATNIAAVSFVAKKVGSPEKVVWSGSLYAAGRTFACTAIAVLAVASLLSLPEVSFFLETNMHKIIGPLLILVGIVLLEAPPFYFAVPAACGSLQDRAGKWGLWGAGLLGIIFALTFCPLSAALFFGSLIPLVIDGKSADLMPSLYGLGTALPVAAFAFVMGFGMTSIGRVFDRLTRIEKRIRRSTAIIFIFAGIYLLLKNIVDF